jgi:hypothetical protein
LSEEESDVGSGDEVFENDQEHNIPNAAETCQIPDLSPIEQKSLAVCAMQIKLRLTSLAVKEFLKVSPLLCGCKLSANTPSVKDVESLAHDVPITIYDVCSNQQCGELFPTNEFQFKCVGCSNLRYEGGKMSSQRENGSYFLPVCP